MLKKQSNNKMLDKQHYDIYRNGIRRDMHSDEEPSLFPPEVIAYGTEYHIDSVEAARSIVAGLNITPTRIEEFKLEMTHLNTDICYFLETYKWVLSDQSANSEKLFFLFNNLDFQLSSFIANLTKYHHDCYYSIFYDWKEEIFKSYNEGLKINLDELFKIYKLDSNQYCCYHHIFEGRNVGELLRLLQNSPLEEIRNCFERVDDKDFCEDFLLNNSIVLSFSQIAVKIKDIRTILSEMINPQYAKRTTEECIYIYDAMREEFEEKNPNIDDLHHKALDCYLSERGLERNKQNINEYLLITENDFKAKTNSTKLGIIWAQYHSQDKDILIENLINARARCQDFDEYFEFISKIEYLHSEIRELKNQSIETVDSLFERRTREAIRRYKGNKDKWKRILTPYRAAIVAEKMGNTSLTREDFNKRFNVNVSKTAFSRYISSSKYAQYKEGEIGYMIEDFKQLKS